MDEPNDTLAPPSAEEKARVQAMPGGRVTFEPGEVTLTQAREMVRQALGPRARIWFDGKEYTLGIDLLPGRRALARGAALHECLNNGFDPFNQSWG